MQVWRHIHLYEHTMTWHALYFILLCPPVCKHVIVLYIGSSLTPLSLCTSLLFKIVVLIIALHRSDDSFTVRLKNYSVNIIVKPLKKGLHSFWVLNRTHFRTCNQSAFAWRLVGAQHYRYTQHAVIGFCRPARQSMSASLHAYFWTCFQIYKLWHISDLT